MGKKDSTDRKYLCLGIESTAHTYSVAVVSSSGEILSNVSDVFRTEKEGMIPGEVARHHMEVKDIVLEKSLSMAGVKLQDIGVIAFSQGPGLAPSLLVGLRAAKELSLELGVSLVGVNHCCSHLEIGRLLTKAKDPVFLYASGVNTQIVVYSQSRYRVVGETLDNGIGNLLDSFARHTGTGFPGGPKIAELAEKGNKYIELPYTVKGMDVSFGGILTNIKQKHNSGRYAIEDICFSLQETVFAMLVEVAERALFHCNKKELLLAGGVACNKRLQAMCKAMCDEHGFSFFCPEHTYLVDNAAQIAWLGLLMHRAGLSLDIAHADISAYERTDDIAVLWRG